MHPHTTCVRYKSSWSFSSVGLCLSDSRTNTPTALRFLPPAKCLRWLSGLSDGSWSLSFLPTSCLHPAVPGTGCYRCANNPQYRCWAKTCKFSLPEWTENAVGFVSLHHTLNVPSGKTLGMQQMWRNYLKATAGSVQAQVFQRQKGSLKPPERIRTQMRCPMLGCLLTGVKVMGLFRGTSVQAHCQRISLLLPTGANKRCAFLFVRISLEYARTRCICHMNFAANSAPYFLYRNSLLKDSVGWTLTNQNWALRISTQLKTILLFMYQRSFLKASSFGSINWHNKQWGLSKLRIWPVCY